MSKYIRSQNLNCNDAQDLGQFFNWSISATGFSELGLGIDKRFLASCSCLSVVSRKIIHFFPEVVDDVIAISGPCKSQIFNL